MSDNKAMTAMVSKQANMLATSFATEERINPFQKTQLIQMMINPDPKNKEVYKQGMGFALTKVAIDKLAGASSMQFQIMEQKSDKDYCKVSIRGTYANPFGEVISDVKTSEIYLEDIKEEIMNRPLNKWEQEDISKKKLTQEGLQKKRYQEFMQFRKFKLQRCETSAKNRVVRSLLGIKNTYTLAELGKPFVFSVVQFAPDFSDPDIKRASITKFIGNTDSVYGESQPQSPVNISTEKEFDESICVSEVEENAHIDAQEEALTNKYKEETTIVVPPANPAPEPSIPANQPKEYPCTNCGVIMEYRQGISKTGKKYACYICTTAPNCSPTKFSSYREGYPDHIQKNQVQPASEVVNMPSF